MTHEELTSIITQAVLETAIAVNEEYLQHGGRVSRADIIREIGLPLYEAGVVAGKLKPVRNSGGVNAKIWLATKDYLRYKSELFN
jgi:hypothetical protein